MRAPALVLAACVVLAGCGGGGGARLPAPEYRKQLDHLAERSSEAKQELAKGVRSTTVAELQNVLTEYAAEEEAIAREIAGLKPPKGADAANAQLANAQADFAARIRDVLPKIDAAPTVRAARAKIMRSEEIAVAAQRVDHALAVLKKLGYMSNAEVEK